MKRAKLAQLQLIIFSETGIPYMLLHGLSHSFFTTSVLDSYYHYLIHPLQQEN